MDKFGQIWTLSSRQLGRGQGHTTPRSLRLELKEADPFVALSKQDCDVSLGGKQGVVEGSRWIFPGPDGFCGSVRSMAKARS